MKAIRAEMWAIVDQDGVVLSVMKLKPLDSDLPPWIGWRVVKVLVAQWPE